MCNQHPPEILIYKQQLENEYGNPENITEITSHENKLYYKDSNIVNTSSTDEIVEDTSHPFITLKNLRLKNLIIPSLKTNLLQRDMTRHIAWIEIKMGEAYWYIFELANRQIGK